MGVAVDVLGVGVPDVHRRTAGEHHAGDDGLVGGVAVKGNTVQRTVNLALFGDGAPGSDKLPGCGGLGMMEHVRHRALLHNVAVGNDGNPIADLLHHRHLVSDDHHGDAKSFVQLF